MARTITTESLLNGGTMDGDVTITGTLTVTGAVTHSSTTTQEGAVIIDVTNTGALLVRQDSDAADVFTVDTTNQRVLIGNTAFEGRLGQQLQLAQTANYGGISFNTFSTTNAHVPLLDFQKSASATLGTNALVADGEGLGNLTFRGSDNTAFRDAAQIRAEIDGTPGASDMPGRLLFLTTADGSSSVTERMRIDNAGNVDIGGAAAPAYRLDVVSASARGVIRIADNTTNATRKIGYLVNRHYTNAEQNVLTIGVDANVSSSDFLIGGGDSGFNAATTLGFYTAANNTTVTGTRRLLIDSAGLATFSGSITVTGDVNPEADGTRDLGTQSTGQWANVWSDLINGADYSYLNGWRTLEADKYDGYPVGWAIGAEGFKDGVVTEKMPKGLKPLFAITEDFIEYKGRQITPEMLDKVIASI